MLKFFFVPPDGATTEYQISNREFSDFCARIIVIFCTTDLPLLIVYKNESFSAFLMASA